MRALGICVFLVLGTLVLPAQEQPGPLDDLANSAWDWAQDNLDEDVLKALQAPDQKKVERFLSDLEKDFNGEYVLDLAALRDTARAVLPLLDSYEETEPYAIWLRSRLDYLDVAEQFRSVAPKPKPGEKPPNKPPPNPTPQVEREVWVKKIIQRPWPENARKYVTRLKPVFAAQQVSPALVWLGEVESSFDPRARSPAGARGLYQLMPATAKEYGLRTTWPFDQRVDPEASARAAAQYLRHLYGDFHDWRLALAAYNAGEGTVRNLLAKHKARSFDAISDHLPAETQMYVPKVEATLLRREGVELSKLPAPPRPGEK